MLKKLFINTEAKEDNRFILSGSDSESEDHNVRKRFVKNRIISSEADTEETGKLSEEGVPENVNEMFDAEDLTIDTSGLTDHINDCVDKLTNGEDMDLADLSSLNVSEEIKDLGNDTEKDTETVPKSMEKDTKNVLESMVCGMKTVPKSPLFLGKGFHRPQMAIRARSIRGERRKGHERELEKNKEVTDTEYEDWRAKHNVYHGIGPGCCINAKEIYEELKNGKPSDQLLVRIVEYFADKANTDGGKEVMEIIPEMQSATDVKVSDMGELSSNNEMLDFPLVGMSPDYRSDVSSREKEIDLEESMEKCSGKISDRNYEKGDGKKDENSGGKVYEKEKSNVLREEGVVLFKQEKGDELTVTVETKAKPVELSKLELLEKEMIEEEFGTDENDLEWTILDDIDAEILKKRTISKCVDLYENDDEEDLDYADFSSVKDGDMLYFKSARR